jgi:hypothetical protein
MTSLVYMCTRYEQIWRPKYNTGGINIAIRYSNLVKVSLCVNFPRDLDGILEHYVSF